ncbi:MAG: hypothetical protein GX601_08850, partial [Anaerolineales bacterium]|nr:hypothetical protein [Anaerolineales bacterium]
ISLACLVVPYLPLLAWQAPLVFRSRTTGFYPYTMGEMARILFLAWGQGVQPVQGTLSTLLRTAMGGLAVWSLWFAVLRPAARKTGARAEVQPPVAETTSAAWQAASALAPLIWILLPYLAVGIVSIWQPLFTDRYLIWSVPAFYMLIAAGLVLFARSGTWGAGFAGILLALILVGNGLHVWRQATVPAKSDLRSAAAYVVDYGKARLNMAVETYVHHQYLPLAQTEGSGRTLIVFQIPHARYAFEYYAPGNGYEWANGAFTNHRDRSGAYLVTAEQNAADMAATTAGYDVVWLVLTEWESWDERGLVQAWLEANAQRVDEAHFLRVDVYRYLLSSAP